MLASSSVPPAPRYLGSVLLGGVAAALVVLPIAAAMMATRAAPIDPCATSFDVRALSPANRGLVARRLLACSDLEHGRISRTEYHQQIAVIDTAWTASPAPIVMAAPPIQWASTVRGFSTQYTTSSWAATRVLGAPDVYPGEGDNANAWASLGADDRDEWLEVGYAQPTRISAVEIYETFNPGAIQAIELVTADGTRTVAYQGSPGATGQASAKLRADLACTAEPIVAVRVQIASTAVEGWNEIDAIGVVPCAE